MWSVFEKEYTTKINNKYQWVKELNFYIGDLTNEDFKNDYRFKEVKDKRKQVKFLGTVETEFPLKFPLKLNNGIILENVYNIKNYSDEVDL